MELRQIETFLQVVADKNMSKAAETLYITQSTVSYRLRTLEEELKTILITRKKGTQNIVLTPQGEKFVPLAREWLKLYEKTQAFCEEDSVVRLCVAAPESINFLLRGTYKYLRRQEPQVSLTVITANSEQISQMVQQKQADIGFSYLPASAADVESELTGSFPMVLVECAPKRETYPKISPKDLNICNAVMIKGIGFDNPNTAQYFKAWFPDSFNFHLHLDSTMMLQSNMTAGDWCLVPEIGVERLVASPDFQIYHFSDPVPQLPYYIVRALRMDQQVVMLLKKYFQDIHTKIMEN